MSICSWGTLLSVFALQLFSPADPPFRLVNREGAISLYARWIKAQDTEVRELKAVFEVNAPLERVLPLLQSGSSDTGWNYGADHHVVISTPGQQDWRVYMWYDMPWPIQDQDCMLHFQLREASPQVLQIAFHSVEDTRFPQSSSRDRISGVRGQWLITSQGNGRLHITYQVSSDRSKKIPRWVSDPAVHAHLLQSLQSFTQKLEQR
jgi:hypothetical protein